MKMPLASLSLLGLFVAVFPLGAQSPVGAAPPVPAESPVDARVPADSRLVRAAGGILVAPIANSLAPQSFHEKLADYATRTFSPRAFIPPAISAAIRMASPPVAYPNQWRQGASAFGRNYGDALARQTSGETGRFLAAALLHEDIRYRP